MIRWQKKKKNVISLFGKLEGKKKKMSEENLLKIESDIQSMTNLTAFNQTFSFLMLSLLKQFIKLPTLFCDMKTQIDKIHAAISQTNHSIQNIENQQKLLDNKLNETKKLIEINKNDYNNQLNNITITLNESNKKIQNTSDQQKSFENKINDINTAIETNKNFISAQISTIPTLFNNSLKSIQSRLDGNMKPVDFEPDIFEACRKGKLSSVKWLIEKEGVDADKRYPSEYRELKLYELDSPLHIAAINGHLDIVKYLISIGIDKDEKNKWSWTALIKASKSGHINVVRYLLSIGANKTFMNCYRRTAYIEAPNAEIKRLLL